MSARRRTADLVAELVHTADQGVKTLEDLLAETQATREDLARATGTLGTLLAELLAELRQLRDDLVAEPNDAPGGVR